MSDKVIILPRAMKAAIEFNVSKDTLVEFLESKGFSQADMQRDFKLSEEMYRIAQAEFQQDKAAKAKAQQIELVKTGGTSEPKKKKDEEDLSIKKKETAKAKEVAAEEVKVAPEVAKEVVVEVDAKVTKISAPELESPKVLDKIDLDKVDSSTRPKKTTKKVAAEESAAADTTAKAKTTETKKTKKKADAEPAVVAEERGEACPRAS